MTMPASWKEVQVGQHASLLNGFAFPSDGFIDSGGMPLIRIRDLRHQTTAINYRGRFDDKYVVRRGDLLIGMDGDFETVRWKGLNALLNQRVCKLDTKNPNKLVQEFLFYRIIDEVIRINRITAATTVKHLSSGDVLRIRIELPPEPEQSKIAEILSTVDRAIEQTEALIAKQQRIKTGLMQDLLTRGIDEHGNLRSEETHEFKDSLIGKVPHEWHVQTLGAALHRAKGFLQTGPFGSQLHAHEYVHEGIPVIMPQDILDGRVSVDAIARVPETRANDLRRHRVQINDIVFSRRGDLSRAAAIGKRELGWLCGTGCFLLRASVDAIDARWLADVYHHHHTQRQVDTNAVGSTMPSLNNAVMEQLTMAFPCVDEQHEITRMRDTMDAMIHATSDYLLKLQSLKTGLMQDLLTGKVRVKPMLEKERKAVTV